MRSSRNWEGKGEGLKVLRFVLEVTGPDESDVGERKDGPVGAPFGGHGGAVVVDTTRRPLGVLSQEKGDLSRRHRDRRQVGTEVWPEVFSLN